MNFLKKLLPSSADEMPLVVDQNVSMQALGRGGNVRARGHQPSTVDCPKCLAHPGQACGSLQKAVYHGPRVTAWKRQVLRARKASRA